MRQEMRPKTFNTHTYIKALTNTGMKEEQAEIIVQGLLESRDYDLSRLATKEQVDVLAKSTKEQVDALAKSTKEQVDALAKSTKEQFESVAKDMERLEQRFDSKLDSLEQRLINKIEAAVATSQNTILKWIIPFFLSNMAIIIGLVIKILGH